MILCNSSCGLTSAPVSLLYGSSVELKDRESLPIESFDSVCGYKISGLAGESPEKQTGERHPGNPSRSGGNAAQAPAQTLGHSLRQTIRFQLD